MTGWLIVLKKVSFQGGFLSEMFSCVIIPGGEELCSSIQTSTANQEFIYLFIYS